MLAKTELSWEGSNAAGSSDCRAMIMSRRASDTFRYMYGRFQQQLQGHSWLLPSLVGVC
jgi:hypothetical protein